MFVKSLLSKMYLINDLTAADNQFLISLGLSLEDDLALAQDTVYSTLNPTRRKEMSDKYKAITSKNEDVLISNWFGPYDLETCFYNHCAQADYLHFEKNVMYTKLPKIVDFFKVPSLFADLLNSSQATRALRGDPLTLNNMLVSLINKQGRHRIEDLASKPKGWKITGKGYDDYFEGITKSNYLLAWEYLNRGFGLYFTEKVLKGEKVIERQLITRSPEILRVLNSLNLLILPDNKNITDFINDLFPASDKANLTEGTASAAYLKHDLATHKYVVKKMQKKINLLEVVPMPAVDAMATILCVTAGLRHTPQESGFIEVRYIDTKGMERFAKVTVSTAVTSDCYGAVARSNKDAYAVYEHKRDNSLIGFDINTLSCRMYDLEASVYSKITHKLVPGTLRGFKHGDIKTVDTSRHLIDYSLLRRVFVTKISRLNKAQIDSLNVMYQMTAPTVRAKKLELIVWQAGLKDADLFDYMTMPNNAVRNVFGDDIEMALKNRKNYLPRYLKQFTPITVEDVNKMAKQKGISAENVLDELMRTGVVHATVIDHKGDLRETYITKNDHILQHEYGFDYIALYGARQARLRACKTEIEGMDFELENVMSTLADYGVDDFTAWKIVKDEVVAKELSEIVAKMKKEGIAPLIQLMEQEIAVLTSDEKAQQESKPMVTGKRVYQPLVRDNNVQFYDTFSIGNVVALEYSVDEKSDKQ